MSIPCCIKKSPLHIIRFILTTLNTEIHSFKGIIVDEDGALKKSTDVTNSLVDEIKISMKTTCGNTSWLNANNERHNISMHNMVISGIIDSNKHTKNGVLQQRHQQKYVDAKSTAYQTIPCLNLLDVVKSLASMKLELLNVIYTS